MIRQLAILGAMGDLTRRYLLPALIELHAAGRLPAELRLIAVSREDLNPADYRRRLFDWLLVNLNGTFDEPAGRALVERMEYRRADVTDAGQMHSALGPVNEPMVAYLALPPAVYEGTIRALGSVGLPEGSRVVVEKPFGEGLDSARALNRLLHEKFPEPAIFRVDHFLGLPIVHTLLGLRFANRVFGQLWHRDHIARVDIIWEETLALEGRAAYYDGAGAVRDMIQNHLLQLLCLVAMEPPLLVNERDLRDRKVDVLRALRRLRRDEVRQLVVRARYGAGWIDGRSIPAYVDEEGVDARRRTETFAQVVLPVDNWRWAGVPFVLRTGKAMPRDRREINIQFHPVAHLPFEDEQPRPNVLCLDLDSGRLSLGMNVGGSGDRFSLEHRNLEMTVPGSGASAYARLLLDVLQGDTALSIRDDEAEEMWRIVEPVLQAWRDDDVPLREYAAGSLPFSLSAPS